jgi:hypothetical protein
MIAPAAQSLPPLRRGGRGGSVSLAFVQLMGNPLQRTVWVHKEGLGASEEISSLTPNPWILTSDPGWSYSAAPLPAVAVASSRG